MPCPVRVRDCHPQENRGGQRIFLAWRTSPSMFAGRGIPVPLRKYFLWRVAEWQMLAKVVCRAQHAVRLQNLALRLRGIHDTTLVGEFRRALGRRRSIIS